MQTRPSGPDLDAMERAVDRIFAEYDVSLESLVRVLVRRGLLSPEELAAEERNRRAREQAYEEQLARVISEHRVRGHSESSSYRRPRSWLKRVMAKRRWTRRLGTFLFGWKWKKVYHRNSHHMGTR